MKSLKYGFGRFVSDRIDVQSVEWKEAPFSKVLDEMEKLNSSDCGALFFYEDVKDFVQSAISATAKTATREQFEADPAKYGVCFYKQPYTGQWVFE